jgi:hypothetical protein
VNGNVAGLKEPCDFRMYFGIIPEGVTTTGHENMYIQAENKLTSSVCDSRLSLDDRTPRTFYRRRNQTMESLTRY